MRVLVLALVLVAVCPGQLVRVVTGRPHPAAGGGAYPTPTSEWLYDEGSGSTAFDSQGAVDLSFVSTPAWVATGLDLDVASNEYLAGGDNFNINWSTTDFSGCFLVTVEDYDDCCMTLAGRTDLGSATSSGWFVRLQAESARLIVGPTWNDASRLEVASTGMTAGSAHLWCWAAGAGGTAASVDLYRDGTAVKTTVADALADDGTASDSDFYVGGDGSYDWTMDGIIHRSALWVGSKLTQADIDAICAGWDGHNGVTSPCP